MDFRLLSSSRVRTSGDGSSPVRQAVKTECDERVTQRCGEPGRLAPVQKHERERGMFLRLHHGIPGMRIGVWVCARIDGRRMHRRTPRIDRLDRELQHLVLPLVLGGYGRNMFINLGFSLGTSAAFYVVGFMTQYLGSNGDISPEFSAWAPLFLFGTIAVARWDTIRT